jgi:hypothetical protein
MRPRVSVLMPVRNGLPWLGDALASLSRQTLRDFEIVLLEDGSTDGTPEFLRTWPDDRLRVVRTGGIGMAGALNIGLDAARAPLVARHDADDVSAAVRLDAQAHYLALHAEVGVLATAADYIDGEDRIVANAWVKAVRRQHDAAVTPRQIAELMPLTCCITHGSVMARTDVLRAAGGYRPAIWPVEDYDLWLRLLSTTLIAKLPHRLYRYRVHDAQLSAQVQGQQLTEALAAKLRYLRRVCPGLRSPARLLIVGEGRGADAYRTLAPAHGFEIVPLPATLGGSGQAMAAYPAPPPSAHELPDVVVVANFAELDAYARVLEGHAPGGVVRIGNFFMPRRVARQEAA